MHADLDRVWVFDNGHAAIGGRYFIGCTLSWEIQVHLFHVWRRPRLVEKIRAMVQEVFESEVFSVFDCSVQFRPNGILLGVDPGSGRVVYREPEGYRAYQYSSGNIDDWGQAYFLYICLQQALNLIRTDILDYAEDHELADPPSHEDGIGFSFKRPRRRSRGRKSGG
jgi:hypothetical protein